MNMPGTSLHRRLLVLAAAALLGLSATLVAAQATPTVLGQDGTVFRLHQGLYADLFGDGIQAYPDSPVLALDVRRNDSSAERLLVPGTETRDLESSASLVFEDKTGVVYLVWETVFNGLHPLLQLISFDGTVWSERIGITSNIFAHKGAPRLVVQRETDEILSDGEASQRDRTTLHLTWWEEALDVSRKRHALIILEEGRYLGWAPILELGDYVLDSGDFDPPAVPGLENALRLQPGRSHRMVVAGFVNPHTHRLITLEIEAISQVISSIADDIRAQIVVIGVSARSRSELAEMARAEILARGTGFHEAARQYLAEQVAGAVEATEQDFSPDGISLIADDIRAQIVVIGSRIGQGGVANPRESEIIEVGQTAIGGGPYHYYQISVVSDRPAPEVGGPAELMLSESGQDLIVTWEADGAVYYRESEGDGWSETHAIELNEDLDRETVYRMLEDRVRAD